MKREKEDSIKREGNKLIAEFMGASIYGFKRNDSNTNDLRALFEPKDFKKAEKAGYRLDLSYHSSWDWLMPVVEKIKNLFESPDFDSQLADENTTIMHLRIFAERTTVWQAVVQFIQWYNQSKTAAHEG